MNREQKRALKYVGVGCGGLLVLFFVLGACAALIRGASEEEGTASPEAVEEEVEPTTETTRERTRTRARTRTREQTTPPTPQTPEETTAPAPQTPEEKLRASIEEVFTIAPEEPPEDLEELQIQNSSGQCYDIYVRFNGDSLTAGLTIWTIEGQMERVYEAVYYQERDLANRVCTVRTEATTELTDNRGHITRETAYVTSLDRDTAATLNWNNVSGIDFPSVWTVEYEHPAMQQQRAKDQLEQAADCLDEGGLFDFDWLECP